MQSIIKVIPEMEEQGAADSPANIQKGGCKNGICGQYASGGKTEDCSGTGSRQADISGAYYRQP